MCSFCNYVLLDKIIVPSKSGGFKIDQVTQLKAPARRADLAQGEERRRIVERLIRELPKLDPFEGYD